MNRQARQLPVKEKRTVAMTPEELRAAAEDLRETGSWMQSSEVEIEVEIEQDEYWVDLGSFGEHSMSVTLRDDYSIDPEEIFNRGPRMESSDLATIAEELDAVATKLEEATETASLEGVLRRMKDSGTDKERMLASVVETVWDALNGRLPGLLLSGELPPTPMPWPGALRPEIDYTAPDFPQRYQPPPGFVWAKGIGVPAAYGEAVSIAAADIRFGGGASTMHLDDGGRVVWCKTAPDSSYANGSRWTVWHDERSQDGIIIPSAKSFDSDSPARALNEMGQMIMEPHIDGIYADRNYNWDDATSALERVEQVRNAATAAPPSNGGFQPPAPVAL